MKVSHALNSSCLFEMPRSSRTFLKTYNMLMTPLRENRQYQLKIMIFIFLLQRSKPQIYYSTSCEFLYGNAHMLFKYVFP